MILDPSRKITQVVFILLALVAAILPLVTTSKQAAISLKMNDEVPVPQAGNDTALNLPIKGRAVPTAVTVRADLNIDTTSDHGIVYIRFTLPDGTEKVKPVFIEEADPETGLHHVDLVYIADGSKSIKMDYHNEVPVNGVNIQNMEVYGNYLKTAVTQSN